MPNDYITLKALTKELSCDLQGGKINKITMVSDMEIILTIRTKNRAKNLILSAVTAHPRVHITDEKLDSLKVPPSFCMILRKYLLGGTITDFTLINNDRLVSINISASNELYDIAKYRIIVEIMGGGSNIILTNDDYKIIDALKRVFSDYRAILPHHNYLPPAQNKMAIDNKPDLSTMIDLENSQLAQALSIKISGLSKESIQEVVALSKEQPLSNVLAIFSSVYDTTYFSPSILIENQAVKGYYVMPYRSKKTGQWVNCISLSHACDCYYSTVTQKNRKSKDTSQISAKLKRLKSRTAKRIAQNENILNKEWEKEQLLQTAEILKSNIFAIKKLQSVITCYDFYNDVSIDIPLDIKLSPQKNVELYYKKYRKLKGAIAYAEKEQKELLEMRSYLQSIEKGLDNSTTAEEYDEIEKEIALLTGGQQQQRNRKKPKKSMPITLNIDDFTVYIGKNNYQNDDITFNIARGGDMWLHVKDYHGAHGIIVSDGKEIPLSVIEKVACFVAFMSGAKDAGKVSVDYTYKKHVKKLQKPGLVHYTKHKTVVVVPQKIN